MNNLPGEIFENCVLPDDKLSDLPSSAGLVLFADSQNSPILLLTAANIRRTVKNKLAEQKDPSTSFDSAHLDKLGAGRAGKTKKADLKSITAKIYYTICPCRFRLALAHYKAVKKIFAQNYKDHETIVYPWFIKIDLGEKIPFFSVTRKLSLEKPEKILGPFPSQKSAAIFVNILEDAFKLCRLRQAQSSKRNDLVNNPEQSKNCPYLQMDACCGVCASKISPEEYQNIIKDAFEAGANPAKTIEKLQADMQAASKELNFEKAAELKRKIENLTALKRQTYRWTGDLRKLKILHIDKSAKIRPFDLAQGRQEGSKRKKQTFAVFAMNFFEIIDCRKSLGLHTEASPSGLGDFVIDDFEKIVEAIENALLKLNSNQQETHDTTEILEQFAIVSYFLYRTKPAGLWINASEGFEPKGLKGKLKA